MVNVDPETVQIDASVEVAYEIARPESVVAASVKVPFGSSMVEPVKVIV